MCLKKLLYCTLFLLFVCLSGAFADEITPLPQENITGFSEKEDTSILSPGTVTVVKPEEMRGEQKSLAELLKRVPGLHIIEAKGRGAYTVASVRGSTAAEVSVFVDGTLMNLGSEAAVDLSFIPVDNVERIEVYRGYVPARFAGASMGGVINIITKKPTAAGGSLSLGVGSFGKVKTNLSANMPLGGGKLLFGANYEKVTGDFEYRNDNNTPYSPADDYTASRQNNGYKNSDILIKWNNDLWNFRGGWKRNDRELPYGAPGADKPTSLKGADLDTDQIDLSLGRRWKSKNLDWGVKADYLHQHKKYDDPNDVVGGWAEQHNEYRTQRLGFAIDAAYSVGENHLIEFLGDYADEKLNARGDIVTTFNGITDFSREAYNLQLQDTINLDKNGTMTITPIIRGNWWDGEGKFSAALAVSKNFGNGWTAKITGGTYNRAPNIYELYGDGAFVRPNPKLKWEDGTQWDVGVTWKGEVRSADVMASLTYFGRRSNNLIEFIMISPRYGKYFNIGKAEINGLEFESEVKWEKWKLNLSATWMDAVNTTGDYREEAPLPNRPKWEGLLRLTRAFGKEDKSSIFGEIHYLGDNYYDTVGTIKMDDYYTVGIGVKYRLSETLKISAGVDDIFDAAPDTQMFAVYNGPARTMWYPMQGRTFYATITWDF